MILEIPEASIGMDAFLVSTSTVISVKFQLEQHPNYLVMLQMQNSPRFLEGISDFI